MSGQFTSIVMFTSIVAIVIATNRASENGPTTARGPAAIEQARKEGRKIWRHVIAGRTRRHAIAGRTDDGQRFRAHLLAHPQKSRQVRDMVGMHMTDGDQRKIAQLGLRLTEVLIGPAPYVDEHSCLATGPKEITR